MPQPKSQRVRVMVAALSILLAGTLVSLRAQVTFDRILRATAEPQNWLTYSGTTMSQRFSTLTQITRDNVKNLALQWIFQAQSLEKFEATPLVVDGVMYTVQAPNDVVALDPITGRAFWIYSYVPSPQARPCCGRVNRGVAILGNTLFLATLDGHLIALDAKSGRLIWNRAVEGARAEAGYAFTVAPLVVKDKVIIGSAGAEYGVRGFLAAFDAATGNEVWRFYTVPGPGEPGHETWGDGDSWKRGGASVWVTGSYDPALNLTYWGLGNPGPDWNGDQRPGDNLYSDSVVALNADTGKLAWHFQFTPHDEMDYDSTQVPVLADLEWQGRPRKAMMWANRNGFMYVLDRTNGEFLLGRPFVKVTWAERLDAKGRPVRAQSPSEQGTVIFPHVFGGTNWMSPSYSPHTELFYIPSIMDSYATFPKRPVDFVEGRIYTGAFPVGNVGLRGGPINRRSPEEGYAAIQAFDPKTGMQKWIYKMSDLTDGGVLSTQSDLVFSGGRDGYFFALDATTGALLWKANLGGPVASGPMTYLIGGRQYIAVSAGNALFAYALP